MSNHARRNWRRRWTVDATKREARHDSGVVVWFPEKPSGHSPGELRDAAETIRALTIEHGQAAAHQVAQRMLREAAEIYARARAAPPATSP